MAKVVDFLTLALVTVLGAAFLSSLAVFIFKKYWEKKKKESDSTMVTKFISGLLKIVIWTVALLLFLDNVGVKVNSIIAGLGIGGVAIAFAAQSILTDIFCYFTSFSTGLLKSETLSLRERRWAPWNTSGSRRRACAV